MTAAEYHTLAPTFNLKEHHIQKEIDQIPWNVNRAGRHYKKMLQAIRNRYETY